MSTFEDDVLANMEELDTFDALDLAEELLDEDLEASDIDESP
jgi:hypothetical protein